jgi:chitodextrinase
MKKNNYKPPTFGVRTASGQQLNLFRSGKSHTLLLFFLSCLIALFSYYNGFSHFSLSTFIFAERSPYGGVAREIPGLIEAEDYDEGGQGVAYYDTDATNNGGAYRKDAVDISATGDNGGGFNVGWTAAGEWLTYTVNVKPGTYNINFRVASADGGRVDVKLDGVLLGSMGFAPSGGYGSWRTYTLPNITIANAGTNQVLRLDIRNAGFNLNSFEFISTTAPQVPSNVRFVSRTSSSINIAWNAATDTLGTGGSVTGYNVYNGKALVGTTTDLSYNITGLQPNSTHTFTVKAIDNDGWLSTASSPITLSTVSIKPVELRYEAESLVSATSQYPRIANNSSASGGKVVGYNWTNPTSVVIHNVHGLGIGNYEFTVRYATNANETKSIYLNDVFVSKISLPSTGSYNTFGNARILLKLLVGQENKIAIVSNNDGRDTGGGDYDFFLVTPLVRPTNPVADDVNDTFGWTDVPEYAGISYYEYTTNSGTAWQPVTANPQPVGNEIYAYGAVQVRVKADPATNRDAGNPLPANAAYSIAVRPPQVIPGETVWRIGKEDHSSAEFSNYPATSLSQVFTVSPDWETRSDWTAVSKGLKADKNREMVISYEIDSVPAFGVELSFRVLDAYQSTPQMAVFSNGTFAGLIQIAGLNGNGMSYKFKETYKLYIPKEFLKKGTNELRLATERGLYATASGDSYLWWEWDYVTLQALGAKATDPLHGRYVHLGNAFPNGTYGAIQMNTLAKWQGMAYSGNWMRSDGHVGQGLNEGVRENLSVIKQLNMTAMPLAFWGDYVRSSDVMAGNISQSRRDQFRNYLRNFGDLLNALELENEPGLFGSSQVGVQAIAKMVKEELPVYGPHLKSIAPGWAYWPSKGVPDGWERDPAMRRPIEDHTHMTNGHSYGGSGVGNRGGSLVETLLTYSDYNGDGFPKDMVMSEMGSNDQHTDKAIYGTEAKRFAASFDREVRANIGYADHIMYHAALFNETTYAMWDPRGLVNPEEAKAWANRNEPGETRLKTYRRLTLAYATHGEPLVYTYTNGEELAGKKAYFRAVNTATLGKSTTGASSDKVLINFVNFENFPQTISVKVVMPGGATYVGERFGAGESYSAARSWKEVSPGAGDTLALTEQLGPGESVQYILGVSETSAPTAPDSLVATGAAFNQVNLSWKAATDNKAVAGYRIYKNGSSINVLPASLTRYTDRAVAENETYRYVIEAFDDSGNKTASKEVTVSTPQMPQTPFTVANGVYTFEAENCLYSTNPRAVNNTQASGGRETTDNYWTSAHRIYSFVPVQEEYILTIRYRDNIDNEKSYDTNAELNVDKQSAKFILASTNNAFGITKVNIKLVPGVKNIIRINNDWNSSQQSKFDYFQLEPGKLDAPYMEWRKVAHNHSAVVYSATTFTANSANSAHETSTQGDYMELNFKGTGFRWFSNVTSAMGKADIYVDGKFNSTIDITTAAFEGTDKQVFEITGLTDALHTVRVQAKENKLITVTHLEFLGVLSNPVQPAADIIITDIKTTPANPKVGDEILFTGIAVNKGSVATPAGIITGAVFYVNGGSIGYQDTYTASIAPGDTVELQINSNFKWVASEAGTYNVRVFVNDLARYTEMDRSNNNFTKQITIAPKPVNKAPIVSLSAPADSSLFVYGKPVAITADASDSDGTVEKVEFFASNIQIGESASMPYSFQWTGAAIGNYYLSARATDDKGAVALSDSVLVSVVGEPDLVVSAIDFSPATVTTDDLVTFRATVKNQGTAALPAGSALSVSFSINGTVFTLSNTETTALEIGQSLTVSGVAQWETNVAGDYTVEAKADAADTVAESDKQNNSLAATLSVSKGLLRIPENPANAVSGLDYAYYKGQWYKLPDFDKLNPQRTGTAAGFDISLRDKNRLNFYGFRFLGYLDVPANGEYTLYTQSDDGSKLYIGSQIVVDNDGIRSSAIEKSGKIGLKAGRHAVTVVYFQAVGTPRLTVSYQGPGLSKQPVPVTGLFRVPASAPAARMQAEVGVEPESGTAQVFPNPATEGFTVEYYSSVPQKVKIKLVDLLSRIVGEREVEAAAGYNQVQFDRNGLRSGTYLIHIHAIGINQVKKLQVK